MLNEAKDMIGVLEANVVKHADRVLFRFLGRGEEVTDSLTYAELYTRALRLAGSVQERTPAGARVLLVFHPGLELAVAFAAVILAGRIPLTTTSLIHKDLPRLQAITASAEPSLMVCGDALATSLAPAVAAIGAAYPVETYGQLMETGGDWSHPGIRPDDIAFLQYTSGSTSSPKGVVVTHAGLLHNLQQIQSKFGNSADDVSISWLPPYHDMGLIGGILEPLFVPVPTVFMPPLYFIQKPLRWLKAIERYQGTATGGPNFALQMCVDRIPPAEAEQLSLRSLRLLFSGAERIRPSTLEAFEKRFRPSGLPDRVIYPCYGLAESTLISTGGVWGTGYTVNHHPGLGTSHVSCGTSIKDQALLIADPTSGELLEEGQVGEILIGSPSVTPGYYRDANADAELFRIITYVTGASLRMLRTGDLGYLHQGELFVTGRCKEVLIIRGRTHYPQDLEEAVELLDDRINPGGVACFAVEEVSTEGLVVYCEIRRSRRKDFVRSELSTAITAMLGRLHGLVPQYIGFLDERTLPRTTSGKLMRLKLREDHLSGSIEEAREMIDAP